MKKKKYNEIIITWNKKSDFDGKFFKHSYDLLNQNRVKNALIFTISLEYSDYKNKTDNVFILTQNKKIFLFFF